MKPRLTIRTFAVSARPKSTLQCRRSIHTRAIAPGLTCRLWSNNTRRGGYIAQIRPLQSQHYASTSTSTQTSRKSIYGRTEAPPSRPTKPSAQPPRSPTSQIPSSSKANEKLNPPPFTYPPDLNVPARAEKQSYVSYIWKCGRAYLSFYKSGVANTRQTAKFARSLRAKAGPTGKVDYAAQLTRAEWQVVRRSRKDMLRLPAFGVIFLIFGEWTPLLVKFLTPIIPEACRVPSQVEAQIRKSEAKRMDRQNVHMGRARRMIKTGGEQPVLTKMPERKRVVVPVDVKRDAQVKEKSAGNMHGATVLCGSEALRHKNVAQDGHFILYVESARYDCYGRAWDLINVTPPRWLLRRNLGRTLEYLKKDDELIERDGGWQALEIREVKRACVERGINVLGKSNEEVRSALGEWFGAKK